MSGLLNRIIVDDEDGGAAAISYGQSKELARDGDSDARRKLAARGDVRPEILYYLAADELVEVRREIAANDKTPRQADRLLVDDVDDEVRCDLARKIARLVPGLSPEAQDQVHRLTFEILEALAHDELPRVRQIVSEEIKRCATIPRQIIGRLARDVELIVSAPVLQYSPLLGDDDLLEIIASEPVRGALNAISRRESVEATVADAIAACDNEDAIAALLANPSAQIREGDARSPARPRPRGGKLAPPAGRAARAVAQDGAAHRQVRRACAAARARRAPRPARWRRRGGPRGGRPAY